MMKALLAAMLLVTFTAEECDLGDYKLGDFVVTHTIAVINESEADIAVSITTEDLTRNVFLVAGAQTAVTSFANGTFTIGASTTRQLIERVQQDRDELLAAYRAKGLSPKEAQAKVDSFVGDMIVIGHTMRAADANACGGELKPGSDGKGMSVTAIVSGEFRGVISVSC